MQVAELWYLCSQGEKGIFLATMAQSVTAACPWERPSSDAIELVVLNWELASLGGTVVLLLLTHVRAVGVQSKLWLELCKLEKNPFHVEKNPSLTLRFSLTCFVFSLSQPEWNKGSSCRKKCGFLGILYQLSS